MVRFSRIWRVVVRMGHPQIRWAVLLMDQHEGMPAELQGNGVDVETLPLKAMECGCVQRRFYHPVGASPTEAKRREPRSLRGIGARKQTGEALRQHALEGAGATYQVVTCS